MSLYAFTDCVSRRAARLRVAARFADSALVVMLATVTAASAGAQPLRADLGVALRSPLPVATTAPVRWPATLSGTSAAPAPGTSRAPWWAPIASVLVPGTGQAMLGQERGVAYLVAEGYLLIQVLGAQRDVSRGIREY